MHMVCYGECVFRKLMRLISFVMTESPKDDLVLASGSPECPMNGVNGQRIRVPDEMVYFFC